MKMRLFAGEIRRGFEGKLNLIDMKLLRYRKRERVRARERQGFRLRNEFWGCFHFMVVRSIQNILQFRTQHDTLTQPTFDFYHEHREAKKFLKRLRDK